MDRYDVVVVGARVGGAATALLLARAGLRVLLVDRGRYGSDTLSTHALMRGGVLLLDQWGVLVRLVEAGTPPVDRTTFHYGQDETAAAESVPITLKPTYGVAALYGPRRTVLDAALIDAASAAGADVRFGFTVTALRRTDDGRVSGVDGHDRSGRPMSVLARLTVGADGANSTVAAHAGAPTVRVGTAAGAVVYGYWSDLAVDGYHWYYQPGHSAGIIPTNDGQFCVFAGVPADHFTRDGGLMTAYRRMLAGAGAADRLDGARAPQRLRTWIGRPGVHRRAYGPGWALVGDAGCLLDPLSTHGITDALRDAELLSRAVIASETTELTRFGADRDRIVAPLFDVVERIAGYGWTMAQIRRHLSALSAAMSDELELLTSPAHADGGAEAPVDRAVRP